MLYYKLILNNTEVLIYSDVYYYYLYIFFQHTLLVCEDYKHGAKHKNCFLMDFPDLPVHYPETQMLLWTGQEV